MATHTASGEWQSFELRMRRRRAERLAIRAEVAAEAGCLDDATVCLEEARLLAPGLPALANAERVVESARRPAADVSPDAMAARGTGRAWLAYVGAGAVAVAAAALLPWRPLPASDPLVSRPISMAVPAPAALLTQPLLRPVVVPSTAPAVVVAEIAPVPPAIEAARQPVARSLERPSSPATEGVAPSILPPVASTALPDAVSIPDAVDSRPSSPVAPPASESGPEPPIEPPQEPLVRGVLNRYAAAYTQLDADAARSVWPGVDRDALARAFEGLASQRVSLGLCNVDIDGARANARCTGSASWAPKVGGRARTEPRNWAFELERTGSGWQILSARVQNR